MNISPAKKYGYLWVTLAFFLISILGHWIFAWFSYVEEQRELNQAVEAGQYVIKTARDTLENWQSEFLQLMWQVAGLAYLWYLGSPQSKESSDRSEEKLDLILQRLDPKEAKSLIKELDAKYPRK